MLFFSATVLWPIHMAFDTGPATTYNSASIYASSLFNNASPNGPLSFTLEDSDDSDDKRSYLWSYLVFTWFFSSLTVYFMNSETFKVVKIRQDYLGTQSTITDRTFRLTGIPKDLRTEEKIKEFVENLEIGHVRSVNFCRYWAEIDGLMAQRQNTLRKLEEAWSAYESQKAAVPRASTSGNIGTIGSDPNEQEGESEEHAENGRLLVDSAPRGLMGERQRPQIRLRFGFLKMRNRKIEYDV
jgi:hypothetical protein